MLWYYQVHCKIVFSNRYFQIVCLKTIKFILPNKTKKNFKDLSTLLLVAFGVEMVAADHRVYWDGPVQSALVSFTNLIHAALCLSSFGNICTETPSNCLLLHPATTHICPLLVALIFSINKTRNTFNFLS